MTPRPLGPDDYFAGWLSLLIMASAETGLRQAHSMLVAAEAGDVTPSELQAVITSAEAVLEQIVTARTVLQRLGLVADPVEALKWALDARERGVLSLGELGSLLLPETG